MHARTPSRRLLVVFAAASVATLALSGCVPNNASVSSLRVSITDDTCAVSETSTTPGPVTFSISNTGSEVNEFEILADDKLRIVGEKENIAPGQTVSYVVQLERGDYFTACKFQQSGDLVGLASFTVKGGAVAQAAAETADEKKLTDAAVVSYVAYVRSQVAAITPSVAALVQAYEAGDDATARGLFAAARISYERIEPTAEAFGDLDPKLDYREVDAVSDGLAWTGFHRIEKDLWPPAADGLNADGTSALLDWAPSTSAQRQGYGQGLIDNVKALADLVNDSTFTVSLADISNGAIALLDEVAAKKITGEEDWWSHTDLSDFAANVEGAAVAFGSVKDIAAGKGAEGRKLVTSIQEQFTALENLLDSYGSIDTGYVAYDTVTDAQRKQLSDQVNALAEPLAQLTHAVLGVDG